MPGGSFISIWLITTGRWLILSGLSRSPCQCMEAKATATFYNNVALFYAHQGDKATALDYYNRALEIYVQLYGDDDARTQLVRNNISKLAEY